MDDTPTKSEIVGSPIRATITGALRSAAQLHPIPASLVQAWSQYESYKTGQRIQELIDNFARELEELSQRVNAVSDPVQPSPDFAELLERTVEKVRKEFTQIIREKYARLLASMVLDGDESRYSTNVQLIESLDALSELDLRVLRLFQAKDKRSIGDLDLDSLEVAGDTNAQIWEVASSLAKLESRGLLVKIAAPPSVVYVQNGLNEDTARWRETKYLLLPIGQLLIESIFD